MNPFKISLLFVATTSLLGANASTLSDANAIQNSTNSMSALSQQSINHSSQQALQLQAEIDQLKEDVKNITIYRNHLASLVESQNQETQSLAHQIEEIKLTRQGIVPLMYKMIDGLRIIVESDRPLKRGQRLERIEKLQTMMTRADVSDAEKYRRILEAYQIEIDYGTKLGAYQGSITLNPAETIEADILYVGRISLVARTLNGKQYWAWNQQSQQWNSVDTNAYSELDNAFKMASNLITPNLMTVPVSLNQKQEQ
ncbi:DUF3450 domain-containing protein [Vibrio aestuarianus]|uniref:DUF3450 domain-containing protein n=1 Tax=Vibrio aestuarianus TaxID=28171 RepID=A0A9X4ITI6_9VIBR|nr:DUF3450 domain-containing protein [Vibrio aestuarianus]MDE1242474.1 DUF3450 domain-containing protein [Vibrio aestuarianus]MDE1264717.1 DUF3450 domain-containing protein [Vibrio aestuarianus]MDE1296743.1 DUF3450 domain-containing protein [Vibrio aestuarianus]